MSRTLSVRLLALLLPLAAACGDDPVSTQLPPEATVEETVFAPSLGIDLGQFTETESGIWYRDLQVGTGDSTVKVGKTVTAHYKGWLPDGTVFDQTSPDFPPAQFTVGDGDVVPGFEAGTLGMKVGGQRIIIIPPRFAYGYDGSRDLEGRLVIPGNTVILFRVDVYAIE